MQSIQSINSWEQFLKLKDQAIQRNNGLAGVEQKSKTQSVNNVNSFKRANEVTPAIPKNVHFQPASARFSGKTVGCNFDAYA